jgi:hypothetical protein
VFDSEYDKVQQLLSLQFVQAASWKACHVFYPQKARRILGGYFANISSEKIIKKLKFHL